MSRETLNMATETRRDTHSKNSNAFYHDPFPGEGPLSSAFDWRAAFAGAFVSVLAYTILIALGVAIAVGKLRGFWQEEAVNGFGIGSAIWTVIATSVSLFAGAYVAGRVGVRKFIEARLGWIHGAVVSALFFMFLFIQVGAALGAATRGFGISMNALTNPTGDLTSIRIACWTFFASSLIGTVVALAGGVVGARVQIGETNRIVSRRRVPAHA
jgi:hypothetical protein